jgi:hypothetical protein
LLAFIKKLDNRNFLKDEEELPAALLLRGKRDGHTSTGLVHIESPAVDGCFAEKAETGKAFSIVGTLVRIHLISMLDIYELLRITNRSFAGNKKTPLPDAGKLLLYYS